MITTIILNEHPCARFLGRTAFNQLEDDQMSDKPTYQELENRIQQFEQISIQREQLEDELRESEEKATSWGTGVRYRP